MAKYISSIRDLMIQANNNISDIKTKAKDGDPEACFQMGMIHLLGIKTPIDFKKASSFFENQSLTNNPDACRLLGFIGECEGNYSLAFNQYANAAGSKSKLPYINKVYEERSSLLGFFKKLVLPNTVLNKEITAIINEYIKGGESKVDACIKLATICNDEATCLEAAQSLYDAGNLYSAKRWLQMGNIAKTNELFITIEDKLSKSIKSLKLPDVLQVIEIEGNALITDLSTSSTITSAKETCDDIAAKCKQTWTKEVSNLINQIGIRLDEEEKARIKKQQEEEEARLKKQKEAERQALLLQRAKEEEEMEKRNRRNKFIIILAAACTIVLIGIFSTSLDNNKVSSSSSSSDNSSKTASVNVKKSLSNEAFKTFSLLSTKELSESDLEGKTKKELEIMRNSIYALHGYIFKREDLRNYFSQFSWYNPTTSDTSEAYNSMNKIEKRNIDFIKKHE